MIKALAEAPGEVSEGAYYRLASNAAGATLLLDAVDRGAVTPANINTPGIRTQYENLKQNTGLMARYEAAVKGAYSADDLARALIAKYEDAFSRRAAHDVQRGQVTFETNCMVCHRMGGMGALRGPNLDGVGHRGLARVLQDVLMPSHDVDPAFRTTLVKTKTRIRAEGTLSEETSTSFVIVSSDGWETTMNKDEIEERRQIWMSPMPSNFGTVIPQDDFLELIAFLLNPPTHIVPISKETKTFKRL